ncbi:MAG: conjugal transfer protein TraN [Pseudomonadota bacterium]
MTSSDARIEGEALGEGVRDSTSDSILASGAETDVPTYGGTDFPHLDFVEDPVGLSTAGEAQRYADDYQTVLDPYRTTFDPTTIDLSSAQAIEADPDTYLGPGVAPDGSSGTCNPLPSGSGGALTYLESCNTDPGQAPTTHMCRPPLSVTAPPVETVSCEDLHDAGTGTDEYDTCPAALAPYTSGTCDLVSSQSNTVVEDCENGGGYCAYNTTHYVYECTAGPPSATFDWGACLAPDASCSSADICVDSVPATRVVNGAEITLPCWEWERQYSCGGRPAQSDCSSLDARPECAFSHEECLSYDADGVTCNVFDRWYQCTTPNTGAPPPPAYVCGDDLYCIDGECTSVTREASTEFKDAMVAMNVMGELRDDFDPDALKIFSGENLKCTKKLFGLSNCCSGKGVPLLTPFLCSSEDRDVDKKDDAGLCHNVGTYCSSKILGVCTTKKQSYCCYGSKLVRILNEQGKAQLGMAWGKPKDPDCEGFLIAQFQQLDLSQMDFGEVYAEFVDAAKLPDEIEMSIQIQEKIEYYYTLHGGV